MTLDADFERVELPLSNPFTIARGTTETATNVLVRLTDEEGRTGLGAAAPSTHYGETAATVEAVLPDLLAATEAVGDPHATQRIDARLRGVVEGNPAARAAVATAVADLAATRLNLPLYRQWGLDPAQAPATSFTVGIADPETMATRAERAVEAGHRVLKVKLGGDEATDRERIAAVREGAPDARVRVDANGAYAPAGAVAVSEALAAHDVEFFEQPVHPSDVEGLRFVREQGAVPVAADESVRVAADVPRVADAVDVVVAKLMKAGSLRETRRVAAVAHAHGCEAMLGCMVASNAAIAPAWHLAPLFEYADLDGALLLADDPVDGVPVEGGEAALAGLDRPGTGAVER